MRFMTSCRGEPRHELEVSDLAPLLRGPREFWAHVDTWVNPAWKEDFSLRFVADTTQDNSSRANAVHDTDSFNPQDMPSGPRAAVISVDGRVAARLHPCGGYEVQALEGRLRVGENFQLPGWMGSSAGIVAQLGGRIVEEPGAALGVRHEALP